MKCKILKNCSQVNIIIIEFDLSTSHSPNDVEYLIVLFTLVPLKFEGRSLS